MMNIQKCSSYVGEQARYERERPSLSHRPGWIYFFFCFPVPLTHFSPWREEEEEKKNCWWGTWPSKWGTDESLTFFHFHLVTSGPLELGTGRGDAHPKKNIALDNLGDDLNEFKLDGQVQTVELWTKHVKGQVQAFEVGDSMRRSSALTKYLTFGAAVDRSHANDPLHFFFFICAEKISRTINEFPRWTHEWTNHVELKYSLGRSN